jgi:hypothetical protein
VPQQFYLLYEIWMGFFAVCMLEEENIVSGIKQQLLLQIDSANRPCFEKLIVLLPNQ